MLSLELGPRVPQSDAAEHPADSGTSGLPYSREVNLRENVALAPLTTLRIGGPARFFVQATTEPGLLEAVGFARRRNLPLFALGGGSNLLIADSGFPGLVLQVAIAGEPRVETLGPASLFHVPAGFDWDAFVRATCDGGLSGVECLAGIPGMVGGSPIQNIGAYGQEVSQTIAQVRALDLETLSFRSLSAAECGFAYRHSLFNSSERGRYLITEVTFRFDSQARPRLTYAELQKTFTGRPDPASREVYDAVRAIRAGKGMLIDPEHPGADTRSAGSFFKNPVVSPEIFDGVARELGLSPADIPHWPAADGQVKLAAAWLIERAGFPRGFALGPVGISSRHTLALVNRTGSASCADLLRLRDLIVAETAGRFGIPLEQEPVFLG